MSTIITVENLGKKYLLRHQSGQQPYVALRDVISHTVKNLGRKLMGNGGIIGCGAEEEEFWALKDVSFEVQQGDRVGIIGRNGAGKSTLLKILSRITEPTTGSVRIKGRVASLLEVGTGFHPELTGRENIYLNGAIMGMSRVEIKHKFDEIVDFAEIEKFLDTPVKRYSTGMYVRLAFAVAAHLEPEILIIDEVLAVGDAQFQKKCLGKMEDVSTKDGRTVLFVSHNMNAIEQLCSRAVILEKGSVKQSSQDVRSVINSYLFSEDNEAEASDWVNTGKSFDNPWFKPLRFSITNEKGSILSMPLRNDTDMWIRIEGDIGQHDPSLQIGYGVFDEDGRLLYWSCHTDTCEKKWPSLQKGRYVFSSRIPKRLFNEGIYRVELILALYYKQWLSEPGKNAPAIYLSINGGIK